jgi:sugar (pentulose or hexulose) kinase
METAGEGGAWGIALLAAYTASGNKDLDLASYLENEIFAGSSGTSMDPVPEDVAGFETFIERYSTGLAIERAAIDSLR